MNTSQRLDSFRRWAGAHDFADCRLVQYSGVDLAGAVDVPRKEIEQQIEGLTNEGFYVDWVQDGTRLYLRVWEYGGPEPDWDDVFAERPLADAKSEKRNQMRLLAILLLVVVTGCPRTPDSSSFDGSSFSVVVNPIATFGRVTLVSYKIEVGKPDASAVEVGLDTATSVLNGLLENDQELRPASGTFIGRFRLEDDGTVRMFLSDGATTLQNVDDSKLTDAFVGAAFSGKCSFPSLGDLCMVYAVFQIAAAE